MKKTLLALSVVALAAGSAQAYNFHIDQTGTDVDFYGSLRVKWESTSNKTNYVNGDVTKEHINHAVDNNGSRFGFKLKQSLGGDFYALGRAEWRMRGEAPSQHDFDHVYTHQLYAGFGHNPVPQNRSFRTAHQTQRHLTRIVHDQNPSGEGLHCTPADFWAASLNIK